MPPDLVRFSVVFFDIIPEKAISEELPSTFIATS